MTNEEEFLKLVEGLPPPGYFRCAGCDKLSRAFNASVMKRHWDERLQRNVETGPYHPRCANEPAHSA